MREERDLGSLAIKIGIAGAIGFGAIASGLFVSRRGRHLMKEAWQGRKRTRIEDRILDALWGDPRLGRRDIDVEEIGDGRVVLSGVVRTRGERRRAAVMAERVRDVREVINDLEVSEPREHRRLRRLRKRL